MTKAKTVKLTTPTSEPVDLKSEMAPVTGSGNKINLSSFDTVISKDNHNFYVLGVLSSGLRVSLRFWKEASQQGTTVLGYRVRIGDMLVDGVPTTAPDTAFHELKLPLNIWTGGASGSGHRSIHGLLQVPAPAWDSTAVAYLCRSNKLCSTLLNAICEKIPMVEHVTPEAFDALFTQLVKVALQDVMPPVPKASNGKVSLSWGGASSLIIDMLNGASMIQSTSFSAPKPTGPVPFAAPHPKDAAKAKALASMGPT